MTFKDVVFFKDNKISLAEVKFDNPDIRIMSTNGKSPKSQKNLLYDIELITFSKNGNILMLKPDEEPTFQLKESFCQYEQIRWTRNIKGEIPFKYGYAFIDLDTHFNL